jgi:hypothetical protein
MLYTGLSMANVLTLFQADTEATEQLALAVAVGAVEAEGLIRLRRLTRPDAPEIGHRGYGKLQAADLLWADTIVVGIETSEPSPADLAPLLEMLATPSIGADRETVARKRVWTFHPVSAPLTAAQSSVLQAFRGAGIQPLELPEMPFETHEQRLAAMKQAGRLCAQAAH